MNLLRRPQMNYQVPTTNYTIIPNEVIFDLNLKFAEMKVLLFLLSQQNFENNRFSHSLLASKCTLSTKSVSKALARLEEACIITRASGWTSNNNKKETNAIDLQVYKNWKSIAYRTGGHKAIDLEVNSAIEPEVIDINKGNNPLNNSLKSIDYPDTIDTVVLEDVEKEEEVNQRPQNKEGISAANYHTATVKQLTNAYCGNR